MVNNSTKKYKKLIFVLQYLHLPPKRIHETNGILSNQRKVFLQTGQCEDG